MMGVPVVCSAILVRRRGLLTRSFHEPASYLFRTDSSPTDADCWDPGTRSMQCGRRHDALKLWCAWQHYGDEGYDARVRRQFALARYALRRVEDDPELVLSCPTQSINVCFEVAGKSSAEICDRLARQGRAIVGTGVVDGRRLIRLVCVNPDQDESDLDTFFREVKTVADQLGEGDNAVASRPRARLRTGGIHQPEAKRTPRRKRSPIESSASYSPRRVLDRAAGDARRGVRSRASRRGRAFGGASASALGGRHHEKGVLPWGITRLALC